MTSQTTEELVRLWTENDRGHYSSETFEAVRSLLTERGVDPLPPQNDPPPMAARAPARPFVPLSQRDPAAAAFWGALLRPILWIGVALAASKLVQFGAGLVYIIQNLWSGAVGWSDRDLYVLLVTSLVQLALVLSLMAGAYLAMRWRARAPAVLLAYAWASLGLAVLRVAWSMYSVSASFPQTSVLWTLASLDLVEPVVYPLLLVFLLLRPQVRELFAPHAPAFEVRPQAGQ